MNYAQTESTSGVDPSWATLNTSSEKTVIATSDVTLAGTYTLTIRSTLDHAKAMYADADITVHLVEILTATVNDMELSQGRGDITQTITPWSYNPSTGDIASYSFFYEVEL